MTISFSWFLTLLLVINSFGENTRANSGVSSQSAIVYEVQTQPTFVRLNSKEFADFAFMIPQQLIEQGYDHIGNLNLITLYNQFGNLKLLGMKNGYPSGSQGLRGGAVCYPKNKEVNIIISMDAFNQARIETKPILLLHEGIRCVTFDGALKGHVLNDEQYQISMGLWLLSNQTHDVQKKWLESSFFTELIGDPQLILVDGGGSSWVGGGGSPEAITIKMALLRRAQETTHLSFNDEHLESIYKKILLSQIEVNKNIYDLNIKLQVLKDGKKIYLVPQGLDEFQDIQLIPMVDLILKEML